MKKKRLNEGCAREGEETVPTQKKFISGDRVNRYVLQMSEEEQAKVEVHPQPFWKVIAGILGTKVENIKNVKREGLGYRVEVVDDMDRLLDDNAKILKRLKDSDDSTYTPDKLDDNFMRKDEEEETSKFDKITDRGTFENFMKKYVDGEWTLDINVEDKPVEIYDTKGKGICLDTSAGKIYTKLIKSIGIKRTGNFWEGWIEANGFRSRFNAELLKEEDEENDELEDLMTDGEGTDTNKDGWMSPEDMGIAQKIDWSDDYGNEISHDEKMAYFRDLDDMYEVDNEKEQVRLKPEEEWFQIDDDMDDWEREGYNSEIAYQNRWRDYRD